MKKLICIFLAFLSSLSLCSCYDNREIDLTAYVIALGIDKTEESYNYTFQISSPLSMGGGGEIANMGEGEENTRVENIVIGAENLYEAREMVNNFLSKKINLSHLKMIAISEETAKEGLESHMGFILREREVRPNTRMCITKGGAEEFLRGINPSLEANTAEYYELVFENGAVFTASKKLWEFVNESETLGTVLPMGRVSKSENSSDFKKEEIKRVSSSKSEFSGLCMIKDYTAVGELSPEKSKIYGLLTGEIPEAEIGIEKNGKVHSAWLTPKGENKISVRESEEDKTAVLRISFFAEVTLSGEEISGEDIEEYLNKEAYAVFLESQKANCDIFGIGNYVRDRCKTVGEWEEINWDKAFKEIYFLPEIKAEIKRTQIGTV
ncbi:MAG: hypothetical protein IKC07_00830 [Clostridia bacterium]|nr:hypothetical protein [Clostridia bacterium]